jgi:hypothetical protein
MTKAGRVKRSLMGVLLVAGVAALSAACGGADADAVPEPEESQSSA